MGVILFDAAHFKFSFFKKWDKIIQKNPERVHCAISRRNCTVFLLKGKAKINDFCNFSTRIALYDGPIFYLILNQLSWNFSAIISEYYGTISTF